MFDKHVVYVLVSVDVMSSGLLIVFIVCVLSM